MIIDVHHHYVPEAFIQAALGLANDAGEPSVQPIIAPAIANALTAIDSRLEDMDDAGVDIAVLSMPPPGPVELPELEASQLCRVANDGLIELAERHPDRFRVLIGLPVPHWGASKVELDRLKSHPLVRGTCIHAHSRRWQTRELEDSGLLGQLAHTGMPVMLHPSGDLQVVSADEFALNRVIGLPASSSIAALELIAAGALDRYSGLDLILPHAGGLLPYVAGRADDQMTGDNEFTVGDYLRNRIWFDSCTSDPKILDFCASSLGAARMMLGSDYPYRGSAGRHVADWESSALLSQATPVGNSVAERWFG